MKVLQFRLIWVGIVCLCGVHQGCGEIERHRMIREAPLISMTVMGKNGQKFTFEQAPENIISLAPNITEIIYALEGADQLVGKSEHCDYPEDVYLLNSIPIYPNFDLAFLKELAPDLVVGVEKVLADSNVSKIKEEEIPLLLQSYEDWDDLYEGIIQLGTLLGAKERAKGLKDSLQTLEKRIVAATEDEVAYQTAIIVNTDPLSVVGGEGFMNEMLTKAGGKNAFGDKESPVYRCTVEEIIQAKPEYLILPFQDDQVYADLLAQYPALTNTPADLAKHVFIVEPDIFVRPGPRLLNGLLELTHILHNKLNPSTFLENISNIE